MRRLFVLSHYVLLFLHPLATLHLRASVFFAKKIIPRVSDSKAQWSRDHDCPSSTVMLAWPFCSLFRPWSSKPLSSPLASLHLNTSLLSPLCNLQLPPSKQPPQKLPSLKPDALLVSPVFAPNKLYKYIPVTSTYRQVTPCLRSGITFHGQEDAFKDLLDAIGERQNAMADSRQARACRVVSSTLYQLLRQEQMTLTDETRTVCRCTNRTYPTMTLTTMDPTPALNRHRCHSSWTDTRSQKRPQWYICRRLAWAE